ncbi:hypothetical protein E4U42_004822 [Claviceps africana]|uniref:Endonuclease/exonuclease/phosphatase domain-containing protein n=1 Tax=Claviceps africana TaxID=83212 RepID=A0A8K0NKI3_9HYPO|nr:hypothetical protein E4U42_004822 [Claviceps africana]
MKQNAGLGGEASPYEAKAASTTAITGSLSLAPGSKAFRQAFAYSTTHPNSRNWIGVYPSVGGGPDQQKYNQDSPSWEYAPEADDAVDVSTANLPPGQYKAYFLADDGYRWLARPIEFAVAGPWGCLSVVKGDPALTFEYSTPHAHSENWIGIYHALGGGGPESQTHNGDSLAWAYARGQSGTVKVDTTKLQPGLAYRAYFLAMGGYKWLANPVDLFHPGQGRLAFIADVIKTHNARRGQLFEASVGGMLENPPDGASKFAKAKDKDWSPIISSPRQTRDHSWVTVSTDGTIFGIPPASAKSTTFTVEALASDGSTAEMGITIPVVPRNEPLVEELTVLSFNLWFGGTQVKDYHAKQVRFIVNSGADIVGLQESTGGHAIRLGRALGWHAWQGSDVGIISRYPMVSVRDAIEAAGSVRIALDQGHELSVWNCHLGYTPYGPYDVCFDHLEQEQVLQNEEKSRRTPQIKNILSHMRRDLLAAHRNPVVFTGDFNAPSHLDWTSATRKLHCGANAFPWPTSTCPVDAGLRDSFREAHPDPVAEPGFTWSPIYLDNDGRREPKDRIDFIYHKGLETLSSHALVVGKPRPQPDHYENEWPSDHAAVRTVFRVRRDSLIGTSSRLLRGVFGAVTAVTSGCAAYIGCAWHGRRGGQGF